MTAERVLANKGGRRPCLGMNGDYQQLMGLSLQDYMKSILKHVLF